MWAKLGKKVNVAKVFENIGHFADMSKEVLAPSYYYGH